MDGTVGKNEITIYGNKERYSELIQGKMKMVEEKQATDGSIDRVCAFEGLSYRISSCLQKLIGRREEYSDETAA